MRDLDKALAALRGGRSGERPRRLGCLVPVTLAIGAMILPAIGAFVALEPFAGEVRRSPQEAREGSHGQLPPQWGAGAVYAPLTGLHGTDPRRAAPHA